MKAFTKAEKDKTRRPGTKAAGSKARGPGTKMQNAGPPAAKRTHSRPGYSREHTPGHRAQKPTVQTAAGFAKEAAPADGAAHRTQKNPSEQAKCAFALLPARRGHVNRGRQKIASLFLAGTVFFCFALHTAPRAALHKRGRRPLLSPASFLKKA